jgi:hypothetical protein
MTEDETQNKALIFFHQDCLDGAASLAVANSDLKARNYKVEAISLHHSNADEAIQSALKKVDGSTEVLFLDVVASTHHVIQLLDQAKSVTVIDHHPAAKQVQHNLANYDEYKDRLNIIYNDNDHSGVTLAFDHFHPEKTPPWYIDDIKNIDLGAVERAKSTKDDVVILSAIIDNLPRKNIADVEGSFKWLDSIDRQEALNTGKKFLRANLSEIDQALKNVKYLDVEHTTAKESIPLLEIKENMFSIESESSAYPRALWPALSEHLKDAPIIAVGIDRNNDGGMSISLRHNPNVENATDIDLVKTVKALHTALGADGQKAGGRADAVAMHFSDTEWQNIESQLQTTPKQAEAPKGVVTDVKKTVELLQRKHNAI